MRPFARATLAALILSGLVASGPAHGGWGIVKPDLKIAYIKSSTLGGWYARVVITNTGLAASAPCTLRLVVHKSPLKVVDYPLQAMPANSGLGVDVYLGTPLNSCGTMTSGWVDAKWQVPETNENNNMYYYIAPPC